MLIEESETGIFGKGFCKKWDTNEYVVNPTILSPSKFIKICEIILNRDEVTKQKSSKKNCAALRRSSRSRTKKAMLDAQIWSLD